MARIVSEGLVGAKLVELTPGKAGSPQVADLDMLASEKPVEMTELMQKAAASLARLDAATLAAEKGLGEVNAIAASINNGEGSLGKLIRDETLHQNLTELSHRSERALTALEDNLAALKETWPISRYFERRAYADRERAVFQPGSSRNSRALATDDLFESGRAVLTPAGPGPPGRDRPLVQVRRPADLADRDRRLHRRRAEPRPGRDPHAGTGGLGSQVPGRQARSPVRGLVQDPQGRGRRLRHARPANARPLDARAPLAPRRDHSVHAADLRCQLSVVSCQLSGGRASLLVGRRGRNRQLSDGRASRVRLRI